MTALAKPRSVSTPLMTGVSRPRRSSALSRSFVLSERCATSLLIAIHRMSARAASLKARIVGEFRAGDGAALKPVLGILHGVLVGDLRQCEPLDTDAKPRLVHHDEHRLKAVVLRRHQPARRSVVVHRAGGIAVDTHLFFDRAARNGISRTQGA